MAERERRQQRGESPRRARAAAQPGDSDAAEKRSESQRPSSGPAAALLPSAFVEAATPASVAPNAAPVAVRNATRVLIAGDRSDPPRTRERGRQDRDAGCAANTRVPASITKPLTTSAAPGDQTVPSPSASGGPATNVTSSTVNSSANRSGSRLGSATVAGSNVRTQAANDGVDNPVAAPSATSRNGGVLAGNSPFITSTSAVMIEPQTSTRVCPPRSTRPPSQRRGGCAADRVRAAHQAGDRERVRT